MESDLTSPKEKRELLEIVKEDQDSAFSAESETLVMTIGQETWNIYRDYTNDSRYVEWLENARINEEYYMGKQISADEAKLLAARGMSDVTVNRVRPIIRQFTSMLTSRIPSFNVSAVGGQSDRETASVMSKLIYHILRVNKWGRIAARASGSALKGGQGAVHMYFDANADDGYGEIKIVSMPTGDVICDPDSVDIDRQDSSNIILSYVMTLIDVINEWPEHEKVFRKMIGQDVDDGSGSGTMTAARDEDSKGIFIGSSTNERLHIPKLRIIERFTRRKVPVWFVQDVQRGTIKEFYSEAALQTAIKDIDQETIVVSKQLVNRIVKIICVVDFHVSTVVLPTDIYPVFFYVNEDTGNPFPQGEITFLRGYQDVLNKAVRIILLHASLVSNPKMIVIGGKKMNRKELSDLRDNFNQSGSMTQFPAGVKVEIINGANMSNAFPALVETMKYEMEYQTGIFAMAQGDPSDAPRTYSATLAIKEYGTERSKLLLRSIDDTLTLIGKVCIQFIQQYYKRPKTIRLIDDTSNPTNEELNINIPVEEQQPQENGDIMAIERIMNDVTVGKYDVAAVTQSYMPTYNQAKLQLMMDLKRENIVDGVAVLKYLDVEDTVEITKRIDQVQMLSQQIEAMGQEIQKLQSEGGRKDRLIFDADRKIIALQAEAQVDKKLNLLQGNIRAQSAQVSASYKKVLLDVKDVLQDLKRTEQDLRDRLKKTPSNGKEQ